MKKKLIISTMLIALILLFCSCNLFNKYADVNVKITYSGEADDGTLIYYDSYGHEAPDGKKIITFLCEFTNNENYTIDMLNIDNVSNQNFEITSEGCLEVWPAYPIYAGETYSCNLYCFVDESMTDEQITEELKNTTFTFSCCDRPKNDFGHLHYFSAQTNTVM